MSKVIKVKKSHKKIKSKNSFRLEDLLFHKYKIILLAFAMVSILLGSVLYNNINDLSVNELISNRITMLKTGEFSSVLLFLVKTEIVFYIISLFIGTSFIGSPLVVLPASIKCIIIGFISSYMYNEFELKGVLFCLLFVFPYAAVTTTSLLFALSESISMSRLGFNSVTNKNTADDISVKLYLLRYLILIIINIICALFNSLLIVLFINKINL